MKILIKIVIKIKMNYKTTIITEIINRYDELKKVFKMKRWQIE